MNLIEAELITVDDKNYLTSHQTNGELFIFSINDKLTVAYFDELLGDDIQWVKNVVVEPEQIGLLHLGVNTDGVHQMAPVTQEVIDLIKSNQYKCFIEVDQIYQEQHDDISVSQKIFEPILIDNKVIIHLKDDKSEV